MSVMPLLTILYGLFSASLSADTLAVPDPSLSAVLYSRAPEVLPGVLPGMQSADYWISRMKSPDAVILSPDRIEAMNRRFEEKMRAPDPFRDAAPERKAILYPLDARKKPLERVGRVLSIPDIGTMRPEAIADTIRDVIQRETAFLRSIPFGNMYAVEYSPREIDAFERETALDRVPDRPEVLAAVTVRTARIRLLPTDPELHPGVKDNRTVRAWDMWNLGVLRAGRPVWLLHRSLSGAFLFALSDEGYGWVRPEDVALASPRDIRRLSEPEHFLVCTGDRVAFYADDSCRFVSGWLRMGDRVPLAREGGSRTILVPLRRNDGRLVIEKARLAADADVHAGYLPYTRRNVVETAFKLLGNSYDWTGAWLGRSHETTWRDIFACFGFRLPCQGELFTHYGSDGEVLPVTMPKEEKNRRILAREPFMTLMISWEHVQLILGENAGVPIVFDNHGYDYTDSAGTLREIKRTCVGDTRQPWYFYDHPVTFLELK